MATENLPSVPNPFGLADKNRLSNFFLGAGFRDVGIETVTVTFEFSLGEDYSRYCQAISTLALVFFYLLNLKKEKNYIWSKVAIMRSNKICNRYWIL